jgi:hypothetical protein
MKRTVRMMRSRLVHSLFVLLLAAASCLAQTHDELGRKYGKPRTLSGKSSHVRTERYTVRPNIIMTVRFGEGLRACELVIEPLRKQSSKNGPSEVIEASITDQLMAELAPTSGRGQLIKTASREFGCSSVTYTEYEKVMIAVTARCAAQGGGWYSVKIRWKEAACEPLDRQNPATGNRV